MITRSHLPMIFADQMITTGYFAMILPGLKFRVIAVNRPSIMSTPGAEMSCSSQAACPAQRQF
jgi:hypothetical protein